MKALLSTSSSAVARALSVPATATMPRTAHVQEALFTPRTEKTADFARFANSSTAFTFEAVCASMDKALSQLAK